MSAFDITGLTTFPTLQIVKLCEADKAQLDRIEALLTELTSLPHNKRPVAEPAKFVTLEKPLKDYSPKELMLLYERAKMQGKTND